MVAKIRGFIGISAICRPECHVLFPVLGKVRMLGMGLRAYSGEQKDTYTIRYWEKFCLSLGLGRFDSAVVYRKYFSFYRILVYRKYLHGTATPSVT